MTKVVRSMPIYFRPYMLFSTQDAVILRDLMREIAQQGERQIELLDELGMGLGGIRADADHRRALVDEGGVFIAKRTGLDGAAGRVVLGVEIENEGAALEIRKRKLFCRFDPGQKNQERGSQGKVCSWIWQGAVHTLKRPSIRLKMPSHRCR